MLNQSNWQNENHFIDVCATWSFVYWAYQLYICYLQVTTYMLGTGIQYTVGKGLKEYYPTLFFNEFLFCLYAVLRMLAHTTLCTYSTVHKQIRNFVPDPAKMKQHNCVFFSLLWLYGKFRFIVPLKVIPVGFVRLQGILFFSSLHFPTIGSEPDPELLKVVTGSGIKHSGFTTLSKQNPYLVFAH